MAPPLSKILGTPLDVDTLPAQNKQTHKVFKSYKFVSFQDCNSDVSHFSAFQNAKFHRLTCFSFRYSATTYFRVNQDKKLTETD